MDKSSQVSDGRWLKERILATCDARNDSVANEVHIRVSAAVSDLLAADG